MSLIASSGVCLLVLLVIFPSSAGLVHANRSLFPCVDGEFAIIQPVGSSLQDLLASVEQHFHHLLSSVEMLVIEAGEPKRQYAFRYVPPGSIKIGLNPKQRMQLSAARGNPMHGFSARNQFDVTFVEGFFLLESEITELQFESLIQPMPGKAEADGGEASQAASWDEAMAFCRAMSAEIGVEVRLPTEVEWEYAARGPEGHLFPDGRGLTRNAHQSVVELKASTEDAIPPSDESWCKLRDMTGNLSEWCLDRYDASKLTPPVNAERYCPSQVDTSAFLQRTSVKVRAIRGGSRVDSREHRAAALRRLGLQHKRIAQVGFRPILVVRLFGFNEFGSKNE